AKEKFRLSSPAPHPSNRQNGPDPGGRDSSPDNPVLQRTVDAVATFMENERMLRRVSRVLIAVSGGPDSVACLEVLLRLRERFSVAVSVAHFDHQLRPDSADVLQWVRQLARDRGLECLPGEGPVADVAQKQGRGIEETA